MVDVKDLAEEIPFFKKPHAAFMESYTPTKNYQFYLVS